MHHRGNMRVPQAGPQYSSLCLTLRPSETQAYFTGKLLPTSSQRESELAAHPSGCCMRYIITVFIYRYRHRSTALCMRMHGALAGAAASGQNSAAYIRFKCSWTLLDALRNRTRAQEEAVPVRVRLTHVRPVGRTGTTRRVGRLRACQVDIKSGRCPEPHDNSLFRRTGYPHAYTHCEPLAGQCAGPGPGRSCHPAPLLHLCCW